MNFPPVFRIRRCSFSTFILNGRKKETQEYKIERANILSDSIWLRCALLHVVLPDLISLSEISILGKNVIYMFAALHPYAVHFAGAKECDEHKSVWLSRSVACSSLRMRVKHVCNGKPNKWRDEMRSNLFMYTLRPDGNYTNLFVIFFRTNGSVKNRRAFDRERKKHEQREHKRAARIYGEQVKSRIGIKSTHVNGIINTKPNVNVNNSNLRIASSWMQNTQR